MALYFKTLRSSSSGNCLRLWTEQTNVIIDCGLNSQKLCRALLSQHAGEMGSISAVLVSHLHQDHINYSALRVLEEHGITVRIHEELVDKFQEKFINNNRFDNLSLKPFSSAAFNLGEFSIKPVKIPHSPQHENFGFVIHYQHCARRLKIVIMTDFNNGDGLAGHFADADFIYVEANHNPGLLKKYPNPNSHYHMKNETVADLLCSCAQTQQASACCRYARPPQQGAQYPGACHSGYTGRIHEQQYEAGFQTLCRPGGSRFSGHRAGGYGVFVISPARR